MQQLLLALLLAAGRPSRPAGTASLNFLAVGAVAPQHCVTRWEWRDASSVTWDELLQKARQAVLYKKGHQAPACTGYGNRTAPWRRLLLPARTDIGLFPALPIAPLSVLLLYKPKQAKTSTVLYTSAAGQAIRWHKIWKNFGGLSFMVVSGVAE